MSVVMLAIVRVILTFQIFIYGVSAIGFNDSCIDKKSCAQFSLPKMCHGKDEWFRVNCRKSCQTCSTDHLTPESFNTGNQETSIFRRTTIISENTVPNAEGQGLCTDNKACKDLNLTMMCNERRIIDMCPISCNSCSIEQTTISDHDARHLEISNKTSASPSSISSPIFPSRTIIIIASGMAFIAFIFMIALWIFIRRRLIQELHKSEPAAHASILHSTTPEEYTYPTLSEEERHHTVSDSTTNWEIPAETAASEFYRNGEGLIYLKLELNSGNFHPNISQSQSWQTEYTEVIQGKILNVY